MDKFWLASYPAGVPAEIDIDEYASLRDVIEESFANFPTRPAFTSMGRSLTFRDLDALSAGFGAWLQAQGLERGARVAVMMPNILQYPVAMFGTLRAGYTVVNVNPLYTARELEHQLVDSGAEVIVVVENFAHTLAEVVARTKVRQVVVTSIGEMLGLKGILVDFVLRHVKKVVPAWSLPGAIRLADALADGRRRALSRVPIGHDDIAFLQYTGGTTGIAKGAILLHRNIVANLLQSRAWVRPFLGTENRQVVITPLPLYHIFSLTANCLLFMTLGGENVLIANPRDIPALVREMARYRFTAITGVNTLFNALLNNADFAKLDFSSLAFTLGGGMAVQEAVARRWKDVTGVTLSEAYGLTETSPGATVNPLDLAAYNGSIGLPIPSTEIVLRDDAGRDVPLGEPGEVCIRGPQVMRAYHNRPEATDEVLDSEGWLRTGDVGVIDDDGYLSIVDRKKDMLIYKGYNVYPRELEEVLFQHPAVANAAVVGKRDVAVGELPVAFVVLHDPTSDPQTVLDWVNTRVTPYKKLRDIRVVDAIPVSAAGKVLRRELREVVERDG